jgi:hypothetical protein
VRRAFDAPGLLPNAQRACAQATPARLGAGVAARHSVARRLGLPAAARLLVAHW